MLLHAIAGVLHRVLREVDLEHDLVTGLEAGRDLRSIRTLGPLDRAEVGIEGDRGMCGPVVARAEDGLLRVDPEPSGLTEILVGGHDERLFDGFPIGDGDTEIHDQRHTRAHVGALGPHVEGEGLLGPTHLEVGAPARDRRTRRIGDRDPEPARRRQRIGDPRTGLGGLPHEHGEGRVLLVDHLDRRSLGHVAKLQHSTRLERDHLGARGLAKRLTVNLEDDGTHRRRGRLDPEVNRIRCRTDAIGGHRAQCHGVGLPDLDAGNRHGACRHGRIEADPLAALVRPLVIDDRLGSGRGREGDGDGASARRRLEVSGSEKARIDRRLRGHVIGRPAARGGSRRRGRGLRECRGLHEAGRESRGYSDDREAGGSHGSSWGYGGFCVHSIMGDRVELSRPEGRLPALGASRL